MLRRMDLPQGDATEGISRKKAFDATGVTMGRTEIPPGTSSGWHHHGDRHLYGFLVAGRLHLEYGPGGTLRADVDAGDFFRVPPRLVHRDVNPSLDVAAVVLNVLAGAGPSLVNVSGPDPS